MWRRYIALATLLVFSGAGVWLLAKIPTVQQPPAEPAKALVPDELRLRLVETLKTESLFDSIKNLHNYDDCVYTSVSEEDMRGFYEHARSYFPRLNRVKRILEQRGTQPALLEKILQEKLAWATKAFPKAFHAELDKLNQVGSYSTSEPSESDSCLTYGGACTYLLTELRVHNALPLMSKIIARKSVVPVNRVFLFYSMHRLAATHPMERLSPEARLDLDAYLKSVVWLPEPRRVKVASGLALVDEGDLRQNLLGLDVGLAKEPQIELDIYPSLPMIPEDPRYFNTKVPKLEEPLALLKNFVDRAYPEAKKPSSEKK